MVECDVCYYNDLMGVVEIGKALELTLLALISSSTLITFYLYKIHNRRPSLVKHLRFTIVIIYKTIIKQSR